MAEFHQRNFLMASITSTLSHLGAALLLAGLCASSGAATVETQPPRPAPDCTVNVKPGNGAKAQALAQDAARTNPCALVPGLTPKSFAAVWSAMLSSGKTGGKRFDTPPPGGLPTGRIMATPGGVAFNLQGAAAEGIVGLQLSSGGAPVFGSANPAPTTQAVPLARLKPGASYDWTLVTRKASYKGSFELLDAEESAAVQARLDALAAATLTPQLHLLYQAAIYDEAELYTARDQLLDELRRQLAP